MVINSNGPLTIESQFSPGLRSFSSLRDFYFFHNYDFGPLGSPRVSEIIIWREEKRKRGTERVAGERSSLRSSKIIITRFVHFPREPWLYLGLEKNNLRRNMLRLWVIYTLQSLGRSETPTQMSSENLGNEQLKIDMCLGNQTISIKSENQTAILKSYNQFKDHRWDISKIWDLWTPSARKKIEQSSPNFRLKSVAGSQFSVD